MVVMGVSESREGLLSVAWVLLALTSPYHPISSIYIYNCIFIYMQLNFMINLGDFPIHEMDMSVGLYDPIPKSLALGFAHPPG